MNTLNKNYLSSAAFYVFLMHSVSGSLSINISFTYWDWIGALRHSVLFIIQIGHLILDPRSFPQRWELSFQHHKITAWSCIAVFFSSFITWSFSFSTTTLHLDFLNGCLPLCTEDQFRLHFQLLLPLGLSILFHPHHSTPFYKQFKTIYFCGSHFSHWMIRNKDKF